MLRPIMDEGDEDFEPEIPLNRRVRLIADREKMLVRAITSAETVEQLIQAARLFISRPLAERLEELLQPIDPYGETDEDLLPRLSFESTKQYLLFLSKCGSFTARLMPGRTDDGEIGAQLLDEIRGDLSLRFRSDGEVWLAVVNEDESGSFRCPAGKLLTSRGVLEVRNWL